VFPTYRVFCLIGTNPEDYDVAWGLSSKSVGVRSDALVQIDNAYVPGANRTFVHCSHSGRYGLVNSEEGYQNLWRFLFGDIRVDADLVRFRLPGSPDDEVVWQLDVQLAIRGLPILMHEQTVAHHCPIQLEWPPTDDTVDRPMPPLATFLSAGAPRPTRTMRYALHLRLMSSVEHTEERTLDPADHLEQTADFDDTLIVDIEAAGDRHPPRGWATWNSAIPGAIRDWHPDEQSLLRDMDPEVPRRWRSEVPVPKSIRPVLGNDAGVQLTITPWT
jgi:hypothetical protein